MFIFFLIKSHLSFIFAMIRPHSIKLSIITIILKGFLRINTLLGDLAIHYSILLRIII